MTKEKCVVMFSGGLDSRLILKIMQKKGHSVTALYFKLPFSKDVEKQIREFCKKQKARLKVLDYTKGRLLKDYLRMVKKPKYGRGAGFNPCIDCRLFMFKQAKKYANKNKIKIIASGEVLGQRPMSQHKKALDITAKESRLGKRLIRPLAEEGITGRSRKKQIQMAKKFKITYPGPAGGCLLCEKGLKTRFKSLIRDSMINEKNLPLISIGRHFINSKRWIVLGRNEKENKIIEKTKGIRVIPKQVGPSAWINKKELIEKAERLIKKHSKHDIKDFTIKEK
jgi:tRNA-specific 2-thiouridylase